MIDTKTAIEEIKSKISIVDILSHYGYFPVKGRSQYLCPFHQDKHASASVQKGVLHCFTCSQSWDVIGVVQKIEDCSIREACKIIDSKFNLSIFRQLTYKEKKLLQQKQKARERELLKKKNLEIFEKQCLNEICNKMRMYEKIIQISKIGEKEYDKGEWKMGELFFYSIEQLEWLDWLFDIIMELPHPENEYDYIYGINKKEILRKIYKLEIII